MPEPAAGAPTDEDRGVRDGRRPAPRQGEGGAASGSVSPAAGAPTTEPARQPSARDVYLRLCEFGRFIPAEHSAEFAQMLSQLAWLARAEAGTLSARRCSVCSLRDGDHAEWCSYGKAWREIGQVALEHPAVFRDFVAAFIEGLVARTEAGT